MPGGRARGRGEDANDAGPSDKDKFEVGARVSCKATFDHQYHTGEVVERRPDSKHGFMYYVHYSEFDKRLDEWLPPSRVTRGAAPTTSADALARLASGSGASGELLATTLSADQKLTRRLKRQYSEAHHVGPSLEELPPIDQHLEKEHQEKTKVKNIQSVELGRHEMDTWYYSPYPEPYASCEKLYVCEYSLKYFRKKKTLLRHLAKCSLRHPPGDEIYRSPPPPPPPPKDAAPPPPRDGGAKGEAGKEGGKGGKEGAGKEGGKGGKEGAGKEKEGAGAGAAPPPQLASGAVTTPPISVFEVDGKKSKVYCQNLCLLSKLFLDHKTLYYDVDPFLFYVLCEKDAAGYHIVGYFSKEKASAEGNNLACILTLPAYQRKGYGRFLIAFSYELSKKEGKVGSPERPLSDLGAVSYRSYWTRVILEALRDHKSQMSIKDISELTAIRTDDVVKTLEGLGLIKYWKGDHIISVTQKVLEEHLRSLAAQKNIEIDVTRLHWTPYGHMVSGASGRDRR